MPPNAPGASWFPSWRQSGVTNRPPQSTKKKARPARRPLDGSCYLARAGSDRLTTPVGVRRYGRNPMEFRRVLNGNESDSKEVQRHQRSHTARVPTPGRRSRVSQRLYSKLCWPCKYLQNRDKISLNSHHSKDQSHIRPKRTKTTISGTNIF